MLEREIERRFGAALKKRGYLYYKWVCPGVSGVPDRIVISPTGRITFVELKTSSGRPSEQQLLMRRILTSHGCESVILHGLAECMDFVDKLEAREHGKEQL